MIARQVEPGLIVYVSEDDAWRELLFGARPTVPSTNERVWVSSDNERLSLVEELALPVGPVSQHPGQ
jgi:hypothetical protein